MRVFGGVIQEIAQNLRQANPIAIHPKGLLGKGDGQAMPAGLDHRTSCLDGRGDDRSHIDRFQLQADLASRDSRDVQQLVHERVRWVVCRSMTPLTHATSDSPFVPIRSTSTAVRIGARGFRSSSRQHRQELVFVLVESLEVLVKLRVSTAMAAREARASAIVRSAAVKTRSDGSAKWREPPMSTSDREGGRRRPAALLRADRAARSEKMSSCRS